MKARLKNTARYIIYTNCTFISILLYIISQVRLFYLFYYLLPKHLLFGSRGMRISVDALFYSLLNIRFEFFIRFWIDHEDCFGSFSSFKGRISFFYNHLWFNTLYLCSWHRTKSVSYHYRGSKSSIRSSLFNQNFCVIFANLNFSVAKS